MSAFPGYLIQRFPRGILEWLQLKGIAAPNVLNPVVQPTIDLSHLYYDNALFTNSVAPPSAFPLGRSLQLTGMLRTFVVGGTLTIGAAAATNVTVSVAVGGPQGVTGLGSWFFASLPAGAIVDFGVPYLGLLPIGSQMLTRANGTAAGADHVITVSAIAAPLAVA